MSKYLLEVGVEELPYKFIPMAISQLKNGFETFLNDSDVKYEKVDFDFARFGYEMVIVNTGKGHADLSREYSEIPEEMKAVAKCLGGSWLADCSMEQLLENYTKVQSEVANDRAILRAIHYFNENDRVERDFEQIPARF